ncbi:MAG: ATP-binding protein [Gammaproteobacteria bacterium]|nr:ATP-binding protein [Gammaproteobacteria bacterium]
MRIPRTEHSAALRRLLRQYPVVALVGPRQVGKSTLARELAGPDAARYFDLEDSADVARLADPLLALGGLQGLVVLDEVQRRPDLFQSLRVLADRRPRRARFLVLGSASPDLLRQGAETLAGRIAFHELPGFSAAEVGERQFHRLWLRGGFPPAFLAASERQSFDWRRHFVRTYLERDLPALGLRTPAATLERFWSMLAHYHGQLWNASEIGRSLGTADTTVRGYLDTLAQAFVVTVLRPWHENLKKRQVKAPKVYVTDSGLLHALLDVRDRPGLERHPKVGASWEGFVAHQICQHLGVQRDEQYFWRTATGAELDLLVVRGRERLGFEIKRTTAPAMTPAMRIALQDLRLSRLYLLHAGEHSFDLAKRVRAIPAASLRDIR